MLRFIYSSRPMYCISPTSFAQLRRFLAGAIFVGCSILTTHTFAAAQGDDDPPDAVAVFNQAQDLHEKGDLAGAIMLYEKALKIIPEFPEAEYQRGVAELAVGNSDEAERSFRRAVELREDWTLALTSLGSLLINEDSFAEAEKLLQRVVELEPQNPPALSALTDLRLKTKAPPNTLQDILTKITALTSKGNPTPSLWTAKAALENAFGKKDLAKSSLAQALAIDPANKNALLQIADIAVNEGDTERAKEIVVRLENDPALADRIKFLKANIFAYEGKFEDALKQLAAIHQQNTSVVEFRNRINTVHTANPGELKKQLESDSKNPSLLGRLCTLYRRDDPAMALEYCRRGMEADPSDINLAIGFGAALVQTKRFEGAVNILRKALEIAPDNSTAHANLATALFQLKRYPEAKAEFHWLTNAQPTSAGAYFFLGIVHDQLSEYLDAMANYQQYLRLADPVENKLDIEKVNLRLPELQKKLKVKNEK
ncbi:MAG: tetratricopeptide repeat protein [Pyrinomonadaceae bacterium]